MTCDFCGREIHDDNYNNDGETIMCKVCQESGKFGHYKTEKPTLDEIRQKRDDLLKAIHEYQLSAFPDNIELENAINTLLRGLPQNIVFVDWCLRSDIGIIADGVFDEPAGDCTIDYCMEALAKSEGIDPNLIHDIVDDVVRQHHGEPMEDYYESEYRHS